MTSFIKVPFATSGDKSAVPDTDAGGGVNMTQGYGQAYSLDPATDPSAKRIERDKMNWLFNRITQAINEIQSGGVAPFITSADNGGSAFSYGKGALVSLGGVVYQSLVASNTSNPPGMNWAALPEKIQPLDATLTALAGLVGAANKLPYFNGADTAALTDLTSVGRDIIGKNDVDAVLQYLGLVTSRFAVVTSSQTITIPNWVTEIYVSGCAGGGGGGGGGGGDTTYYGGGGGGGGGGESIIKRKFTVSAGASLSITIGAAGVGANSSVGAGNDGTAGGNTVIGSLITLNGGGGGKGGLNTPTPGGTIGGGIGGSGYPSGASGSDGILTAGTAAGGFGSSAQFGGGGGNGRAVTIAATEADGINSYGYGSGGGGGGGKYGNASMGGGSAAPGGSGGNGAPGIVIIEW